MKIPNQFWLLSLWSRVCQILSHIQITVGKIWGGGKLEDGLVELLKRFLCFLSRVGTCVVMNEENWLRIVSSIFRSPITNLLRFLKTSLQVRCPIKSVFFKYCKVHQWHNPSLSYDDVGKTETRTVTRVFAWPCPLNPNFFLKYISLRKI